MSGSNIKVIRIIRNLKQEHVAERVGVSRRYYITIENDEVNLSPDRLNSIAVLKIQDDINNCIVEKYKLKNILMKTLLLILPFIVGCSPSAEKVELDKLRDSIMIVNHGGYVPRQPSNEQRVKMEENAKRTADSISDAINQSIKDGE